MSPATIHVLKPYSPLPSAMILEGGPWEVIRIRYGREGAAPMKEISALTGVLRELAPLLSDS